MPTNDWQFWLVTAIAVAALAWLIKTLTAAFSQKKKPQPKKTTLTINGQKPKQKP